MSWFEDPLLLVSSLPVWALPLAVFFATYAKYVAPFCPSDSVVLLAAFFAGQGAVSPWVLFLAGALGGGLGAATAFGLGHRYGQVALARAATWRGPWNLGQRSGARLAQMRDLFQRYGERLLLVNRFLIGVRSFMLYGAGTLKLRFAPSMAYAGLSHLAFLAILMALGLWGGSSWQQLLENAQHTNQQLGLLVTGAVAVWLVWMVRRAQVDSRRQA